MLQIGRYKLGFGPASMIVVFVVLSICAIVAAVRQSRPEWSMPLSRIIIYYESMALLATLVYGIFVHFAIDIINRIRYGKHQD